MILFTPSLLGMENNSVKNMNHFSLIFDLEMHLIISSPVLGSASTRSPVSSVGSAATAPFSLPSMSPTRTPFSPRN